MIEAIVLIEADPGRIADLADALLEISGVAEVYSVTGDADIVAVIRVREHEHLADVVTHGIALAAGVRRTNTLVAFRSYRNADFAWDTGAS